MSVDLIFGVDHCQDDGVETTTHEIEVRDGSYVIGTAE